MLHLIRILALVLLWPSMSIAQPVIHLGTDFTEVQIDAVEPGGRVALFGAHRRLEGYRTVAGGLRQVFVDEDGDGSVTVELEIDVPLASVWVAVDLTSGRTTVAWPDGFEATTLAAPTLRLRAEDGTNESVETLAMSGRLLDVFLIRPGEEAAIWHQTLANGGPRDVDSDPTVMSLRLGELDALAGDLNKAVPAPASMGAEDLVVLLDPTRLRWQITQGEALLNAAEVAANGSAQ